MMAGFASEGSFDVARGLDAGRGRPIREVGDHVADHVVGRTSSVTGKPWAVSATISAYTAGMSADEAISTRAAASVVESRTHAFRRTAGRLRRARAVNAVELTRGLG